jgi:MerR family transcriptional regulator, copper efflux regulator
MRIGDAAAATGLTKKAIKYYEAEGLVAPRTDPHSGYREYDDDIARLELIHTLRLLDGRGDDRGVAGCDRGLPPRPRKRQRTGAPQTNVRAAGRQG